MSPARGGVDPAVGAAPAALARAGAAGDPGSRSEVLLIGGRSGVGKSSVAWEVSSRLRGLGIAHACIEGDALDQVHPAPEGDPHRTDITRRNLAAIWGNYHRLGHRRLVYCNTVAVLAAESAMITGAMGGPVDAIGVLLTGRTDVVAERLRRREIGGDLDAHLQRSAAAAAHLDAHAPEWVNRVPTDGRSVGAIAAAVIELTGWSGTDAAPT